MHSYTFDMQCVIACVTAYVLRGSAQYVNQIVYKQQECLLSGYGGVSIVCAGLV